MAEFAFVCLPGGEFPRRMGDRMEWSAVVNSGRQILHLIFSFSAFLSYSLLVLDLGLIGYLGFHAYVDADTLDRYAWGCPLLWGLIFGRAADHCWGMIDVKCPSLAPWLARFWMMSRCRKEFPAVNGYFLYSGARIFCLFMRSSHLYDIEVIARVCIGPEGGLIILYCVGRDMLVSYNIYPSTSTSWVNFYLGLKFPHGCIVKARDHV